MKVAVLFTRVVTKPMYLGTEHRRWETYLQFRPTIPHELIIVNRYADADPGPYEGVATRFIRYDGGGWDCGTWKDVGGSLDADLVVCCNSSLYFVRSGWLDRLVDEFARHGTALYGPLASLLCNPHLRTPCLAFPPEVVRGYPEAIVNRDNTFQFEALGYPRTPNFTMWCRSKGWKTWEVTWDGCYDLPDWRRPANIYSKGDQSNCLVRDRHCDLYYNSTPEVKRHKTIENGG